MKKTSFTILATIICQMTFAQVAGNVNYEYRATLPDDNINIRNVNVNMPQNFDIFINVKGLANVKADSYVAIFSVTQVGVTAEEVNALIDGRISKSLSVINSKKDVETYVDMVSFVPVYEFELETEKVVIDKKKSYNKETYNEIPQGFELKKNIHIKYSDPNQLNDFMTILSKEEIYDLVRVDYFSSQIENVKKLLMEKAEKIVQEKIKNIEILLVDTLKNTERKVADGYKVVLPVEMYKSYEAYNSTSVKMNRGAGVNQIAKTKTLYYQPILDKEFDFVINPTILEPVIQVMYEVKLTINRERKRPVRR